MASRNSTSLRGSFTPAPAYSRRSARQRCLRFEALEDRHMLAATLWVDPNVAPTSSIFSSISAAVSAAHNGDTIKVVAGTYQEQVDVNKSLTLIGGQVRASGEPRGPSIVASGTFGFELDANSVTVKNFTIQQETQGILTVGTFSGFNILHNAFLDDLVGINLNTSFAATVKTTTISGNKFINDTMGQTTSSSILSGGFLRNVTISGNTFAAGDTEVTIDVIGLHPSNNVQILNNRITDSGAGITIANVAKAKIDGNSITSVQSGAIHVAGAVTSSEVANNTLSASPFAPQGIHLDEALVAAADTGNKIAGNTIGGYMQGISLESATHNTVSGNTISSSFSSGITLSAGSTSNTISTNNVTKTFGYGIDVSDSSGNMISKNNASGCESNGIVLTNASSNALSGNAATFNGVHGILLSNSSSNTLSGNTAVLNADHGIFLEMTSGLNTLSKNIVNSNGTGIEVSDSDQNKLSGNTVSYNGGLGIFIVQSNENTLSANTASFDHGGIVTQGSNMDTLSGNTANHNTQTGFALAGNQNTITANTANSNQVGFSILGSSNMLTKNTANGNAKDGADLLSNSSNDLLKGNFFLNNGGDGLNLFESPAIQNSLPGNTISGNMIKNNGGDGIHLIQSNDNTISGNLVMANDRDGIDLDINCNSNTISGNTAMGNGDAFGGFDLSDASDGGGTAGTANTWAGNKALTRSPAGLL